MTLHTTYINFKTVVIFDKIYLFLQQLNISTLLSQTTAMQ
jgi:hypothetical protein